MTYLVGHIPGRVSVALYRQETVAAKTTIIPAAYFTSEAEAAAFGAELAALYQAKPEMTTLDADQLVRS